MFRSRWTTTSRCKEASELSMEPSPFSTQEMQLLDPFGSFFAVPYYPTFSKREILPTNRGFAWTLQGSVGPRPTVCMNLDPATESKCFEDWEPSGAPRTLGADDLDHFGEQRFRDLDCRISNQWISATICYHQRHCTCKLEENGKTAWKSLKITSVWPLIRKRQWPSCGFKFQTSCLTCVPALWQSVHRRVASHQRWCFSSRACLARRRSNSNYLDVSPVGKWLIIGYTSKMAVFMGKRWTTIKFRRTLSSDKSS